MIFFIILICFLLFIFIYFFTLEFYPNNNFYRIVYYIPTGKAIGAIIKHNDVVNFYYYINDLNKRTVGLKPIEFEHFLLIIKRLTNDQYLSFDKFESYFSNAFYITPISPFITLRKYGVARDILKAYENSNLTEIKGG